MTSTTSLENLQSCRDATQYYMQVLIDNREIAKYNSDQTAAAGAAYKIWQTRKQLHDDKVNRWQNRTGEYAQYKDAGSVQLRDHVCGACGTVPDPNHCNNGEENVDIITDHNGCGFFGCGKRRRCRIPMGPYNAANPGTFNEPMPEAGKGDFSFAEQISNAGNIQCCANIMNITGDSEDIVQTCSQKIDQAIKDQQDQQQKTQSTQNQNQNEIKNSTLIKGIDNKLLLGGGVAFISLFLLIVIISSIAATRRRASTK